MGRQYVRVAAVVLTEGGRVPSRPMLALGIPGVVEGRANRPADFGSSDGAVAQVRPVGCEQNAGQHCEKQPSRRPAERCADMKGLGSVREHRYSSRAFPASIDLQQRYRASSHCLHSTFGDFSVALPAGQALATAKAAGQPPNVRPDAWVLIIFIQHRSSIQGAPRVAPRLARPVAPRPWVRGQCSLPPSGHVSVAW